MLRAVLLLSSVGLHVNADEHGAANVQSNKHHVLHHSASAAKKLTKPVNHMVHAMEKAAKRRQGKHHSKKSAKGHSHREAAEIIPANYAGGDLNAAEEAHFEHIAEDLETFELKKNFLKENQNCLPK